jgi:lipid-binding SYLF domain-containing protein
MRSSSLIGCTLVLLIVGMSGCASIPGNTAAQQAQTIDDLVDRTLPDLYKQDPKTKEEIANSVGYAIMENDIVKVPVFGEGSGYGVAINNKTGQRTYITMTRFDIGGGDGGRIVRPVVIFQSEQKFKDFTEGAWSVGAGAEAAAKVGTTGAAGGAGSSDASDKGYTIHMITDSGVAATATVDIIHVSPVKLK